MIKPSEVPDHMRNGSISGGYDSGVINRHDSIDISKHKYFNANPTVTKVTYFNEKDSSQTEGVKLQDSSDANCNQNFTEII